MRRPLAIGTVLIVSLFAALPGQDTQPTITIGTATAKRGELAYGELPVAAGVDSGYSISVAVIHGAKPGKVVAFVAGAHGTEYTSAVALTRLITRIDPAALTGTVIVVPLANVASFEQMTVHVNPIDHKGMNNGYPGDRNGSQSQRGVAAIAEQVVASADIVVDLHGGDIDEDLRPYTYWTRIGDAAKDAEMRKLVMAFGIDHVILRDADVANPGRTLGGYALGLGKLSIVAEAGRSGQVLPADINTLVNGSLNVLGSLGMMARVVKPVLRPVYITAGTRVPADKVGMWFPVVLRDTRVAKDQVVGYTTDYVGRKTGEVKSPVAGLVTFIRTVPSMPLRATLINVSEFLSGAPWVKPGQ
jgi:predicted deacylase